MQANPGNNERDLFIAFSLVMVTYMIVALCCYISFNGSVHRYHQVMH